MHKKNVLLQSKVDSISKDFDVLQKEKDALLTMNIGFKKPLNSFLWKINLIHGMKI